MNKIKYLQHSTSLSNAIKILKEGFLYTNIERAKHNVNSNGVLSATRISYKEKDFADEFPGIYMSAITDREIGNNPSYFGPIIFCLSNKLLQQKNYHINITDNNGLITESITYYPHNIDTLPNITDVEKYYKQHYDSYASGEVVFHDKININLICEIWCKNLETYNNIINNIPKELKNAIKIKISKKNTNIKCNIDEKYLDLKSVPFFINIDYNRSGYYMLLYPYKSKKHSSMSHYKKILRIANIDETIINKLTTPKLMDNYLIKNKLYTFFHNNRDKQNLSILDDTFYKVSF